MREVCISRTASMSACKRYRYTLERVFASDAPGASMVVCMLNPSVADATRDDPTITRLMRRATDGGYQQLTIVNMFAYRSPYPEDMWRERREGRDIIGPANDAALDNAAWRASIMIVAWGIIPGDRDQTVLDILYQRHPTLFCWGKTTGGFPRHPLYLGYKEPLTPYTGRFAR